MKKREDRRRVLVKARLKAGSDWHDVTIRNVSSRGMMAETTAAVDRGEYIEIRRGADVTIVARVVWRRGYACGLRTQDAVPVGKLLDAPTPRTPSTTGSPASVDRRSSARDRADRSVHAGRMMQHAALAVAVVAAAIIAGHTAYDALSRPLEVVRANLGPGDRPS